MSEQVPQQPVDYLQEHPNAIQDEAKAEIMAYASAGQEEMVVASRALALDAASNIGNDQFRDLHNRGAKHSAESYADDAEKARRNADIKALGAAAVYDRVKGL